MSAPSATPDAEAYRLMRAGRLAEALSFAREAVAAKTACSPTHGVLAMILLRLGRAAEADAVIESAVRCPAGTGDAYNSLAHVALALGSHEHANVLYRRAVELGPNVSRHWFNLASSERSFGRLADAEAACDRAIALDSREYRGYLLRSELRTQTTAANHVEKLRHVLARSDLDDGARVLLGYALGKELDDLGQYEEAFKWFGLAASARRRQLAYDVALDERKIQHIIAAFPHGAGRPGNGRDDSSRFVFIVGLPRSGTTLLERILTGLPGVRSNGETENFERALTASAPAQRTTADRGARDVFARAATLDWDAVAAVYARLADAAGVGNAVIEKLPLNYLYLGAIHRALPQARLVLISRSPIDVCFAMYRTLFGDAYPFTYHFEDLARYYAAYSKLIAHWREAFGEAIHEVRYEELVSDPVHTAAALAGACGLEWRDSAVEVERNGSVCLTQSAAQVRRPIYRSSTGRWRDYHTQLEPLIAELRRRGVGLGELDS
ncbi:MAG TPA: sulfotransferase [Steroidobacteraceae bacterium]|jgi:tetratricopeptide (TPR) repeat protein|nr:sulfotransferase [Steroidobacteraceae bacterium]